MKEKKEECGIFAIYSPVKRNMGEPGYNALLSLQHRGQDACGIAIQGEKNIYLKTGVGLVREVIKREDAEQEGYVAIGHTRYPTTGRCELCDVQPVRYKNMVLAHNGHISNYPELRERLEKKGYEFKGTVDSEVLLYLINEELKDGKNFEESIKKIMEKVVGAYSVVSIINGKLLVFRDPHAIRPLVYGKKGQEWCFCSESVALDVNGFEYAGEVKGGEYYLLDFKNNEIKHRALFKRKRKNCMFEYVYFSRPDSIINGRLVNEVRKKLGEVLAEEHPAEADVVIPVPDTSRTAAITYARKTGIKYEEGLIKNRYVGRTFIMMTQEGRRRAVRMKLNPIKKAVRGKRVVLVDDSIVRGTTMKEMVKMLRETGALEIHLRITCPPIKSPCFYGVDMPSYKELIANNKTIDEIKDYLNVESLGYLSIEGLKKVLGERICTGCLNGDYFSEYVQKKAERLKKMEEREKDGDCECCC